MKSRQAGFTLIEVVAVAALLGVLVTMQTEYISGTSEFKDAKGEALVYTASDTTYTLTGMNAAGEVVTSGGSKASE